MTQSSPALPLGLVAAVEVGVTRREVELGRRGDVDVPLRVDIDVPHDVEVVGPEVGAEDEGRPVRLQLADETIFLAIIGHPTAPEDSLSRTGRDGEPDARTSSDVHEPLCIHLDGIGPVVARSAQQGRPEQAAGRVELADEHIVVLHRPVRTVVMGSVEGALGWSGNRCSPCRPPRRCCPGRRSRGPAPGPLRCHPSRSRTVPRRCPARALHRSRSP